MVGYRADIDGLRAIAVGAVVLYHAGVAEVPGGFLGVDVFFVISGFLITRIIATDVAAGRFSLLSFYERRARRILPALFVMMAATLAAGWFVFAPHEYVALGKSVAAATLSLSNVWFHHVLGDYFSQGADLVPLLHTWSLAVEEQFYVALPLLLLLLGVGRPVVAGLAAICAASFVLAVVWTQDAPAAAFYLPFTRFWELGVGAVLALTSSRLALRPRAAEAIAAAGLALVLGAMLLHDSTLPFPGVGALAPVAGAAMIILGCGAGRTRVAAMLSAWPLVALGLISYSLYLWHWPIMAYARILHGDVVLPVAMRWGLVGASLVVAWASTRFIERPFRNRRWIGGRAVGGLSAAGVAGALAAAAAIWLGKGLPQRIDPAYQTILAAAWDRDQRAVDCADRSAHDTLCAIGASEQAPSFVLWGDSHAAALMPTISAAAATRDEAGLYAARFGCAPLVDVAVAGAPEAAERCRYFNAGVLRALEQAPTIDTVILAGRWAVYAEGDRPAGEPHPPVRLTGPKGESQAIDENFAIFAEGLSAMVDAIRATGRKVVLIGSAPEIGWSVPQRLYFSERWQIAPPHAAPDIEAVAARNARVDRLMAQLSINHDVSVISLASILCAPACRTTQNGAPLYYDSNHLAATASRSALAAPLATALWPDGRDTPISVAMGDIAPASSVSPSQSDTVSR